MPISSSQANAPGGASGLGAVVAAPLRASPPAAALGRGRFVCFSFGEPG